MAELRDESLLEDAFFFTPRSLSYGSISSTECSQSEQENHELVQLTETPSNQNDAQFVLISSIKDNTYFALLPDIKSMGKCTQALLAS